MVRFCTATKALAKINLEHTHRNPNQKQSNSYPFPIQRDWKEIGMGLESDWIGIGMPMDTLVLFLEHILSML